MDAEMLCLNIPGLPESESKIVLGSRARSAVLVARLLVCCGYDVRAALFVDVVFSGFGSSGSLGRTGKRGAYGRLPKRTQADSWVSRSNPTSCVIHCHPKLLRNSAAEVRFAVRALG